MGLDQQETSIRQQLKSDETTSEAHLKSVWMEILPAVTMSRCVVHSPQGERVSTHPRLLPFLRHPPARQLCCARRTGWHPGLWGSAKEGQTEHGTGRTEAGLVSPLFPVISPETGSPKRCWNGPGTAKFLTFPLNWPSTTCALPRHRRLGASLRMRGTGRAVRAQRAWLSGREPWHSRCNQDAISQTCQTTCVPHRTLHLLRDGFPGSPSSALTKFPNGAQRFLNGRPVEDNLQLNAKPLGSVEAQRSSTEP